MREFLKANGLVAADIACKVARVPSLVTPDMGNVFGRRPRVELHVHGPGGAAVPRELLACIEVAVVQGPLDGLISARLDRVAGSSH